MSRRSDLVQAALVQAIHTRLRGTFGFTSTGLVYRSDAGTQYVSIAFTKALREADMYGSIGSVGDAYNNALMETINGPYKAECIRSSIFHDGSYKTLADVEYAIAAWAEWFWQ